MTKETQSPETIECQILVLKDLLRRAKWHLGTDIQSSPPTTEETKEFINEISAVLREHK